MDSLDSHMTGNFNELLARPGVVYLQTPVDVTSRLVQRDLERRRPFLEIGAKRKATGFRDAVIWESILELLQGGEEYSKIFFVTKDGTFIENHDLHPHLLDDLDAISVDRGRVVRVNTLFDALSQTNALLQTTEATESQARLLVMAGDAVFELIGEPVSPEMVYGGDYEYPGFVQFATGPLESPIIEDFTQRSDFELVKADDTNTVTASATFEVSLEGFILKSELYAEDPEKFGGITDWNDHYFLTNTAMPVRAVVKIDTSGDELEVVNVELHDPEVSESRPEFAVELEIGEA